MGKIAFMFAGQGAQAPGMGEAFYESSPEARAVFDAVESICPGTIDMCFRGQADQLNQTVNTQPCLFATDLACAMAAVEAGLKADCCAGFSLGELCAVRFADMLSMEQIVQLVRVRAETMQMCNEAHPGAMAAVLKLTSAQVEEICADMDEAWPVNYNSPGQTVVACASKRLPEVTEKVKAAGGRVIPLKVGGSFHTPVMLPASEALAKALADMAVKAPVLPVYANMTAHIYTADEAAGLLSGQASHPVRWQQTLENMASGGVDTFIEFGPGTTLSGLVKRTLDGARTCSVCDPQSLEKCLDMLKEDRA